MFERSVEFWVALISGAMYVFLNSKEKALHYRVLMVASSAGFGFSLASSVGQRLGVDETVAGVIIIVFGYLVIDLITALVTDRTFIKDIIKGRLK